MNRLITLKKHLVFTVVVVSCSIFGAAHALVAQSTYLTASNLGLGGGGTAWLDSYHANFVNPANLMLNENIKPRFSMGFMGIGTSGGGSLINISVYNEYFTKGLTVSGEIADEALDKWFGSDPGNMRNAGMQLDVVPFGAAYRSENWSASLAWRTRVLFNTKISRGFAELGIYGLDGEIFSSPSPVNFNMEMLAFHEVSLGYSRKLLALPNLFGFARNVKIYAGVAPKLLLAAHTSSINFRSVLLLEGAGDNKIDMIRHDFAYTLETNGELTDQLTRFYEDRQAQDEVPDLGEYIDPQPEDMYGFNASGWGFDLGGTIEMDINVPFIGWLFRGDEKLRIGVSLTDIGRVTFSDKAGRFTANDVLEWRGFEFDQKRIDREFNGNRDEYMEYVLRDSLAAEIYGSFAPAGIAAITRPLPSMVNFGAQLVMNKLSISVDTGKGFTKQGTNSKRVYFSGGLQYRLLGFIPLRVGMRTGGLTSTTYSAGVGLEFKNFECSIAASTVRESLNHGSNAAVAWSGLVFRF